MQRITEMPEHSPSLDTLADNLQKLAAFEPQDAPVVSLYLNLAPDQRGRDNYEAFCRKAFATQLRAFKHAVDHASLVRDFERITAYLATEVTPSANGLAIFSSASAGDYFAAVQLDVPLDGHWLFISRVPHLYPLVRLINQYPRYASVVLDTNQARVLVFGLGTIEKREQVKGVKTRRNSMGGWSQARYQRRAENFHLHHLKEVVETLDRVVREESIQRIIVLGDDVVVSSLKDALPVHLTEKVVDASQWTGMPAKTTSSPKRWTCFGRRTRRRIARSRGARRRLARGRTRRGRDPRPRYERCRWDKSRSS